MTNVNLSDIGVSNTDLFFSFTPWKMVQEDGCGARIKQIALTVISYIVQLFTLYIPAIKNSNYIHLKLNSKEMLTEAKSLVKIKYDEVLAIERKLDREVKELESASYAKKPSIRKEMARVISTVNELHQKAFIEFTETKKKAYNMLSSPLDEKAFTKYLLSMEGTPVLSRPLATFALQCKDKFKNADLRLIVPAPSKEKQIVAKTAEIRAHMDELLKELKSQQELFKRLEETTDDTSKAEIYAEIYECSARGDIIGGKYDRMRAKILSENPGDKTAIEELLKANENKYLSGQDAFKDHPLINDVLAAKPKTCEEKAFGVAKAIGITVLALTFIGLDVAYNDGKLTRTAIEDAFNS